MGDSFACYLRVSTDRQGRSGLGIEAQRTAVASYLAGFGAVALAEFVEVEREEACTPAQRAKAVAPILGIGPAGRVVTAEEAERIGLLNRVVPAARLLETSTEIGE